MRVMVSHFAAAWVVLALIAGSGAHATPTITTFTEYSVGPVTDADGPVQPLPGDPPLLSTVSTLDGASLCGITGSCAAGQSDTANAVASQRETVFGIFSALSSDATFYNGSPGVQDLTARTTWQESPLVAGPNSISLFIKPGALTVSDFGGMGLTAPTIRVSYLIELKLNGTRVFFSEAVLLGGRVAHTLTESGTDLGGTFFEHADFPDNVFGYRFDPYFATFALGVLTPSDVVDYVMEARVSGPGFETGGRAVIGDPFDLVDGGSSIRFTGQVPESASLFMLGLGLMAVVAISARRSRARIAPRPA